MPGHQHCSVPGPGPVLRTVQSVLVQYGRDPLTASKSPSKVDDVMHSQGIPRPWKLHRYAFSRNTVAVNNVVSDASFQIAERGLPVRW